MNYEAIELTNNKDKKRFELKIDGNIAFILYKIIDDNTWELFHTEVPETLEGKGVGKVLAEKAFQYCKEHGITINPTCPFLKTYILRHPEWKVITTDGNE